MNLSATQQREDLNEKLARQCQATKLASKRLALSSRESKDRVLRSMAKIIQRNSEMLIAANGKDLQNAKNAGLSPAMIDRLTISATTIQQMQEALEYVAGLADPLAGEFPVEVRPNGIQVTKKRIPLGVILMIYESRPNVTVEAAALALKSGNGIILRGGKEAFASNQAIAACWREALEENQFDGDTVRVLDSVDRQVTDILLKMDELIDVVIPRGGEGLIRHVVANSYIPVIKHYKGVCHLFIDESADAEKAINLLLNGKTQRPGVCNALEGVLVHQAIAKAILPKINQALKDKKVTIYGCEQSQSILDDIEPASEKEFLEEFLDLKISMKVVENLDEVIAYIDRYGSYHTEVIATENQANANRFVDEVDASVVMVNASSRFSDGGELGLGAEIGISTSKLHAYGPMGLESLTSEKFVVTGAGQIRE